MCCKDMIFAQSVWARDVGMRNAESKGIWHGAAGMGQSAEGREYVTIIRCSTLDVRCSTFIS